MRCLLPRIEEVFYPRGRVAAVLLAWLLVSEGSDCGRLTAADADPLNSSAGSAGPELLPRVDEIPARTAPERTSRRVASRHRSKSWRIRRATAHSRPHHRRRHLLALTAGRHRYGAHAGNHQSLRRRAKRKSALRSIHGFSRHPGQRQRLHARSASRTGRAFRHRARRRAAGTRLRKRAVRVYLD